MAEQSTKSPPSLDCKLRWLCGVFAIALAAMAFFSFCRPPVRYYFEKDADGKVVKQTESPAELATPFIVVFLTASGMLLYAINGYRITKFAAAGIEATTTPASAAEQADNYYKTETTDSAIEIEQIEEDSPEPTEAPAKVLERDGELFSVFELQDIPFAVIADVFKKWPKDTSKPPNLAEFEFATRKRGKGNHPWFVKFNGCNPIKVSYGGQAKSESTVRGQE